MARRKSFAIAIAFLVSAHCARAENQPQPIYLAGIFSLSGFGAAAGRGELNATQMAIAEINRSGGISGRRIEIVYEDNASSLRQTATAFKRLFSTGQYPVLLGPNWVEFAEVASYLAEAKKVVMLTASGYKENAIADNSFVFTTWPKHKDTTKPLAEHLRSAAHRRLAAVVTENAYYSSVFAELRPQLAELGVSVDEVHNFAPGEKDYRSLIARMKSRRVDGVLVLLLEDGETSSFINQTRVLKFDAQLYGTYGLPFDTAIYNEPSIADGVIVFDLKSVGTPDFRARYQRQFGDEPVASTALAYDNVYVIKQAIERCGAESEAIKRCLHTEKFSGITGPIEFDREGNVVNPREVTVLKKFVGGKLLPLD